VSFKSGDRVRLKLKPERVGTVDDIGPTHESYDDELYVLWDGDSGSSWRFPEELEPVPPPPEEYVGKKVTLKEPSGDRKGRVFVVLAFDPGQELLVLRATDKFDGYFGALPVHVEVI
jgi:hypothetical protein